MKKLLFLFLGFLLFSGVKIGSATINVYNWGELIAPETNKIFTEKTGIKVNYNTYQNNEELLAKLRVGGASYDVIFPSDYAISKLIDNNMLAELDFKNIPNYKFIKKEFKNLPFDPKNKFSVPYVWGMVGIFYNKKVVKLPEDKIDWNVLWNKNYAGQILMFDSVRDSFAISLLRLGYNINTTNLKHLQEATEELQKQKPLLQAYVMDQIFDKMANEEAAIAPYYAGDAANIIKNNSNIGFVIPKSGSNRFIDSMCIPKNSSHKKEAEEYINFMCETQIALQNMLKTGYSTPHKGAFENLPESIKNNKIFYPDEKTIENSQIFLNLPEDISKKMDELWVYIKSDGSEGNVWLLFAILGSFIAAYVGAVIFSKYTKKKKRKKIENVL